MENIIKKFKISKGDHFDLKDHATDYTAGYKKEDAEAILADLIEKISALQTELYAENKHALLIIFQAMDAAGKDSAIAHTMSGLNPQGCQVYSFKQPSAEDLDHDFLWRHYKALPERGRIGIHNRSHYENVLVCKVHPQIVIDQRIPGIDTLSQITDDFWDERYNSIRNFETHLTGNGTTIVKFFLNVSKDEQKARFLKRIDKTDKHWKFSSADIAERQYWNDYMAAYKTAINQTATNQAPWYVIPADNKWFTRIAISTIVLQVLEDMKLKYPVLDKTEKDKLTEAAKILKSE
ncbi:PPK2 family polyphosphate:nucleotide phosphotransferase [Mucilaginibacter gracilis]|uniref:PPK2 family polyphosphate:nucleotide phosphotransferase n=1 Tax=Mucilaginibacter gracilis TaxID=423350 RepID=A0A495J2G3_9SPHI|nr:polyphosphate kinase 2 family protein [Mucilaginibacter gracilis]RKR83150.1 PPK2 family polyphosphate:nucleotide phosphotransferase [Mucilaginibacter gracilis]